MKKLIQKLLREYFDDGYDMVDFDMLTNKKPKLKSNDNFNLLLKDLGGKKTPNKVNSYYITNGSSTIYFKKTHNPKKIELDLITTEESKRGGGSAKDIMGKFLTIVDKYKYRVELSVVPRDGKTNEKQLKKFYSDYGFKNVSDFEMVR